MRDLAKVLVGFSAFGFVAAVVAAFMGPIMNIAPGTFGRGSLGLAALAIAVILVFESPGTGQAK
jgi:hypothetical protein